jgi:hypothetical protein
MIIAFVYVGCSVVILLLLTVLYTIEDVKGKRIFMVSGRESLDRFLNAFSLEISRISYGFAHGFMRLLFHYGAHSILKRVLSGIRNLEVRVENLVRANRKIAKDIRNKTRTHLSDIADHKEEVALTDKEKEKMMLH